MARVAAHAADFKGDAPPVKGNTIGLSSPVGVFRDNLMQESATIGSGNDTKMALSHDILVVDDSTAMSGILVMFLELEGFKARAVGNGAEALGVLEKALPRIAFIDLSMPVMDGLELARRIRAQENGADIRLVALTGWDDEAHRQEASEAGFDDYLVKPVKPATLRELLARLS
jgi:CheY-like chemotaxis protein